MCEDEGIINNGVYGSRQNRRSHDPVLADITQVDLSLVTCTFLAKFNNDATACFDRILPHIATVCLRSFGMPKKLTSILGLMLQYAKYSIKTSLGTSETTYSYSEEDPVFGSGQGSSASTNACSKMCSDAFYFMDKQGHGFSYSTPDIFYSAVLGMLGFVDDNNASANGATWEDGFQVIARVAHDAQLWNDILTATGGALNLDKCFFQVLEYVFSIEGRTTVAPRNPAHSITVLGRVTTSTTIIKSIYPYTPYNSLGT